MKEFVIMQTYCIIKNIDYVVEKTSASTLTDGYMVAELTVEQINEMLEIVREVTGIDQDYLLL